MTPAQRVEAEIQSELATKLRQENRDYVVWKSNIESRLEAVERKLGELEQKLKSHGREKSRRE